MLREVEPLDADSDAALHESVVALVERALALEMQARGLEAQHGARDRAAARRRLHPEHLHDPRLNVATLARVFGVSRRNVYNIFLPSRVTPHAWIQNARLDRACALLEVVRLAQRSVAAHRPAMRLLRSGTFQPRLSCAAPGRADRLARNGRADPDIPDPCTASHGGCTKWQVRPARLC